MSLYVKTPLIDMLNHSNNNRSVKLKMEAYQPPGSFKVRGMDCICRDAIKNGATHLVSSSGGNAGLSAAYVGRKLGVKVTVVIPKTTLKSAIQKLEDQGATVIVHGDSWDDANKYALSLVEKENAAYIPPFDNPKLWEGHSTLVDELKEECTTQPDLIILSVGGGGLLNGVVEGLIRNQWTDTHILAVETEGAASLYKSITENNLTCLESISTIATSLGAKQVAAKALEYAKSYKIIPHLVTDKSAATACIKFLDEYRTLVEPACGASLSVIYDDAEVIKNFKNIAVVVCGGSIINIEKILQWKEKYNI